MADFYAAFRRTEKREGPSLWTNIKGDSGGETWSGISRRANPDWEGWKILDAIPNKVNRQKITSPELERMKRDLYRERYWEPIWGDRLIHQEMADLMYDTAVNMGVRKSIILAQRVDHMEETGVMSEELLEKLNSRKRK